jgi:hypothetical protein
LCYRDWWINPFKKEYAKKLEEKKENENAFGPFPNLFKKIFAFIGLQNNS